MNKNNPNIRIIQTRKYKNINLYLRFSISYTLKRKAILALLSKMLCETSLNYPNKTAMTKAKDMLYGITCDAGFKARANIINLSMQYSFINPKFIENVTIEDYVNFIYETLFNSLIDEKKLKEAKTTLISSLKRNLDKPKAYSVEKTNTIIAKNNKHFDVFLMSKDFIKEIRKVSVKDVKDLYKYLLNKAQLNVYLAGDLDAKTIKALTSFNFDNRKKVNIVNKKLDLSSIKDTVERKNISQSYLHVLYNTPFNKKHKDFYAWVLGNIFLGIVPTSLLFETVREKLSLCYTITVTDYKNDGLVDINTCINGKNKDIVINEINKQINNLITKNYDVNKLEMSRSLFINSLESTYDDLDALINYYTECDLTNFNVTIEEYINGIIAVTQDDIARVFKKYKYGFSYMLKGKADE